MAQKRIRIIPRLQKKNQAVLRARGDTKHKGTAKTMEGARGSKSIGTRAHVSKEQSRGIGAKSGSTPRGLASIPSSEMSVTLSERSLISILTSLHGRSSIRPTLHAAYA